MASLNETFKLASYDLPLWMLGLSFTILGLIMASSGLGMYQYQAQWKDAVTTTGRVILTEWKQQNKENRLLIRYAYKDDRGVIYHNGAVLGRKLGKLNLEPGAAVVVEYKPDDHSQSMLQLQLGSREWVPLLILGILELAAGCFFVVACIRRLAISRALISMGIRQEATVIGWENVSGKSKRVVCEYRAGNGQTYKAKSNPLPLKQADAYTKGQTVKVIALADKPDIALMEVDGLSSNPS